MGFSIGNTLGDVVHGIEHGAEDFARGESNWNGPHQAGGWLEKAGRVAGALSNPVAVAGDAAHNLAHPVETWHTMPGYQKDIVKGAAAVGAVGLGVAGGGALLGGGAAAAEGGAAAAGEASAGEAAAGAAGRSWASRIGRGLLVHEAVHGITSGAGALTGGLTGAGGGVNPYEAQAVAHQQLGALNASQFG